MVYVIEKAYNLYRNLATQQKLLVRECNEQALNEEVPYYILDNRVFNKLPYKYELDGDSMGEYPPLRENDVVIEVELVNHELIYKMMSYSKKALEEYEESCLKKVASEIQMSLLHNYSKFITTPESLILARFYRQDLVGRGISLEDFLTEVVRTLRGSYGYGMDSCPADWVISGCPVGYC